MNPRSVWGLLFRYRMAAGPRQLLALAMALAVVLMVLPREALTAESREMHFRSLSPNEGLSQASVNALLQDSSGFMWIATEDGVDRYDGYSFTNLSMLRTPYGHLDSNFVVALAKDQEGTLYIGTEGGLSTRNPRTGAVAANILIKGQPALSPHERITRIYVDHADRLWIGTSENGLLLIDKSTQTVRHFQHDDNDRNTISDNQVLAIMEDLRGGMWVGTVVGLDHLDTGTGQVDRHPTRSDPRKAQAPEGRKVLSLLQDMRGQLWIGTADGLLRHDPRDGSIVEYHHSDKDPRSLPSELIQALLEDEAHRVWLGTDRGLALWNRDSDNFINYTHDGADSTSLPANNIKTLYQDRSGLLWVGTDTTGAALWNPRSWHFGHHRLPGLDGRSVANIGGFAEDQSGTLWIATLSDGLRAVDPQSGEVTASFRHRNNDPNSLSNDRVNVVLPLANGKLLVGTHSGLSYVDPSNRHVETYYLDPLIRHSDDNSLVDMIQDSHSRIWIASSSGGLALFDPVKRTFRRIRANPGYRDKLPDDHLLCLLEDPTGRLWIGTDGSGLVLFDPITDRFTTFAHDEKNPDSLGANTIYSMRLDERGTIWIGTLGAGLEKMEGSASDPAGIHFRHYGSASGLENSTINAIESDRGGNLWVSTNHGLARLDVQTGRFRSYHHTNGLQAEEYNEMASLRTRNGELLFGGVQGWNEFYPEELEINKRPPAIVLTGFSKMNVPVGTTETYEYASSVAATYREPVLSFDFAAMDFTAPENNQFAYMLQGFDTDWIQAGTRHQVTYTNLAGGHYVFKVRGANSDGTWNEAGASVGMVIDAPPWLTMPAKIGYAIGFVLLGALLRWGVRSRLRRERLYAQRLAAEVRERTAELEYANQQLLAASLTDPLTGLGNRRYLSEAMTQFMSTDGGGEPHQFALMMVDLDNLKPINDVYGHEAGDRLIKQIVDILRRCCRTSDYIVRWGGDEFVIVYQEAGIKEAEKLAESIRNQVAKQIFRLTEGKAARSSCSIGFCCYPFIEEAPRHFTWEQTLAIADAGMNHAKEQRNCWIGISGSSGCINTPAFFESLEQHPERLETEGVIKLHRTTINMTDTGAHQRLPGRRNSD